MNIPKILFLSLLIFSTGCGSDSDSETSTAKSGTVIHDPAYDFSADATNDEFSEADVFAQYQMDDGTTAFFPANDTKIKNMGEVALSSVTTDPESYDDMPIIATLNNVYFFKLSDGIARVKVTELTGDNMSDAAIKVEYEYTSGSSF